jgi:hypothetical protein
VQPFQNEGGFFASGREQGVERLLGLVEVAQPWGPAAAEKEGLMYMEGILIKLNYKPLLFVIRIIYIIRKRV